VLFNFDIIKLLKIASTKLNNNAVISNNIAALTIKIVKRLDCCKILFITDSLVKKSSTVFILSNEDNKGNNLIKNLTSTYKNNSNNVNIEKYLESSKNN